MSACTYVKSCVFHPKFGEIYKVGVPDSGVDDTVTYLFRDEAGNELVGVEVGEETIFTATANDIRLGTVAATSEGVTEGTKVIPSYNTSEGIKVITSGDLLNIRMQEYDYTKLQALVCSFNTSLSDSVATDKVAINNNVYDVRSTASISVVNKNAATQEIEFGITNTSDKPVIIRYMCYKEIY